MRLKRHFKIILMSAVIVICSRSVSDAALLNVGEKIDYSVKYLNIIPIGSATLEVKDIVKYDRGRVYLATCEARSAAWLFLLFKARAVLRSYIDMNNIYPYRFEQVLKMAGKPDDIRRVTYDRAANIMDAEGKGRKNVPGDVRDSISAIYFLRAQELDQGAEINQIVNNNQSNYVFNSKVVGKKKIGKYECLELDSKIRRENKSMYHSMDTQIFVTDDNRHVPVLIKAKTKLGPVTLKMVKYDGVKK